MAGIIFCHLVLTTPIIFKTLDEDSASRFLRAIFPRYYALIFLLSLPATLILYFQDSQLSWWIGFNISAHALFGLIGIPITNAAKDRGWETIFSFSHGFSVYCAYCNGKSSAIFDAWGVLDLGPDHSIEITTLGDMFLKNT